MTTADGRVTSGEFDALAKRVALELAAPHCAVAVSGGADSMALLLLAAAWAEKRGIALTAATVDHRLRAASTGEAKQVAAWCAARGIAHVTLVWRGVKPATNVQAEARTARYRLLGQWCRRHGVAHLLVAHHLEDQAETVLLRLGRGSGVDGLTGMGEVSTAEGVFLLRPLLTMPKARLVATLRAAKQEWIEDPSNANTAYQRVRVRQAMELLAPDGLAAQRIATTAERMRRVQATLVAATADLAARALPFRAEGWCSVDLATLRAAPDELALRALRDGLRLVGGQPFPPRLERLEALLAALRAGQGEGRTLHGCRLAAWRGGTVLVREGRGLPVAQSLPAGREIIWDGRFRVRRGRGRPVEVAPLGASGWRQAAAADPDLSKRLPRLAGLALPALWRNGILLAVPSLGLAENGAPEAVAVPIVTVTRE